MGKRELRQEARARQGNTFSFDARSLQISGGSSQAEFESGSEGLVHLATDLSTGEIFRIKCFWEPDVRRRRRSDHLVDLQLADLNKLKADALGGAPFGILPELGPCTPFALLMRNVRGESWSKLKMRAQVDKDYPPPWWPPVSIRATWAYGLATGVMNMERREFVHADLSPGNVVINDGIHGIGNYTGHAQNDDEFAGDMALVDFDRYIHSNAEMPELGKGTEGYAAKEVWQMKGPELGSDRMSMAILIQEFIVVGDTDISKGDAFDWSYSQESQVFDLSFVDERVADNRNVSVHPLLVEKYPSVAELVEKTVQAPSPDTRPAPQSWKGPLRDIVYLQPSRDRPKLREIMVEEVADGFPPYRLTFSLAMRMLDLSETRFRVRTSLKRDPDGSIYLAIHDGADIRVKLPGRLDWIQYAGGTRVEAQAGMVLLDKNGSMSVRLLGPR